MRVAPWRGASVGLPARCIRGVLVAPRLTYVPSAPDWVLGVCAAEGGRALTVVDLHTLHGAAPGPRAPGVVLVVTTPAGLLGVAVDTEPTDAEVADLHVDPLHLVDRVEAALVAAGAA